MLQSIIASPIRAAATPTPSPSPAPDFNPDTVTPGLVGFAITFLIAVAVVLLILDMVRRIRRVRYRDEIRQLLDNEQLRELDDDVDPKPGTERPGTEKPGTERPGTDEPGDPR
ncbi:hypothetical protein G3T36_15300 [Diaminobutyricibacter tongyongensis]|uniref:Uncharacterized protein n=1 Tax=Leifsonia tongyongensis TaxID=1268043 RepID=A0A6L9Y1E6_9MICO|nr:hypothetical protein [Diaminobutyricibacter tongyongensis]NEN07227.1 hypothetical protein [Diaminobutyricibacter tongyongensis]